MITAKDLNKPTPIIAGKQLNTYQQNSNIKSTIKALQNGEFILINEFFNDGLQLLAELQKECNSKVLNLSFKEQQANRDKYQKLSNLILLEIVDHQLSAKKSPHIGWLSKLYPDNGRFMLTFPQIQGLNSAWQWFEKGIALPVIRNKIKPYYGTYFPTRFEHLILFENFLNYYKGPKKTAIDVGIGCGVLSLQMINHKFQKVFATDINPNAIFGLQESMSDTKLSRKIELDCANLFGKWSKQTELIVFNPPWLPETRTLENLDKAMYYNETLFEDFFHHAKKRLLPNGQIVLIFSNLAQITKMTNVNPIEKELDNGDRFKLISCHKKQVKAASAKTKRDQHWRDLEEVELWVLQHNDN
nr:methyltransferase [uncultured Psychroserpens sp.]